MIEGKEVSLTEEELLDRFQNLLPVLSDEGELQEQLKESQKVMESLLRIEEAVRSLSLFSPNEAYGEVKEEHLSLIDLPYYIGLCCQKQMQNRLFYVQKSQEYFKIYLGLLQHYELLPSEVSRLHQKITENESFQAQREDRIELFRLEKAQKEKVEKSKGNQREFIKAKSQLKSIAALNNLLLIPQEIQLLKFREELEKDPEKKKQYEKETKEYVPP